METKKKVIKCSKKGQKRTRVHKKGTKNAKNQDKKLKKNVKK